jgi:DNA polymerase III delta subunit
MIVLIVGPDAALARREVMRQVAAHDPDGANTSFIDGRQATIGQVVAAVGSAGFFGGRRVVVVADLLARVGRGGKGEAGDDEEASAAEGKSALDLAHLFAAVPDQNVLVLVDASLTALPAAVKRIVPTGATVVVAEPPRGRPLLDWLRATARELGGAIDERAAQVLVETLYPQTWANKPTNPLYDRPPDTALLRNELAKLTTAADPGAVTADHVKALVTGAADDRLFRFLDAAAAGRLGAALGEWQQLALAGEEAAKITAQLLQQVELTAVAAAGAGQEPIAIGRQLGLSNPNRMAGIAASAGARDRDRAFAAVAGAVESDRALKRGRLRQPADQLYDLLVAATTTDERRGGRR